MSKTLNIYNGQKSRAEKLGKEVHYTLEEFRNVVREEMNEACPYCNKSFTLTNLTSDHRHPVSRGGEFTLPNTITCCQPCNFQKGNLNSIEFLQLQTFLNKLNPDSAEDIKRRLTLGGKWAGKMYGS